MDIYLLNTPTGLMPMYDEDYDEKKKLRLGTVYKASVSVPRNLKFHNKYFALINVSWEFLNEAQQKFFVNRDGFRKTIQVAAGWYEPVFCLKTRSWVQAPKSISFSSMSEDEFEKLYNETLDVITATFMKDGNRDFFLQTLKNFM